MDPFETPLGNLREFFDVPDGALRIDPIAERQRRGHRAEMNVVRIDGHHLPDHGAAMRYNEDSLRVWCSRLNELADLDSKARGPAIRKTKIRLIEVDVMRLVSRSSRAKTRLHDARGELPSGIVGLVSVHQRTSNGHHTHSGVGASFHGNWNALNIVSLAKPSDDSPEKAFPACVFPNHDDERTGSPDPMAGYCRLVFAFICVEVGKIKGCFEKLC